MRRPIVWRPIVLTAAILATALGLLALVLPGRTARFDPALDERTEVRPSLIPGGGLGLYARVPIKRGEVIGELGGRYVTGHQGEVHRGYVAAIPTCALEEVRPWRYIDAFENGGHVARANFAPRTLNGVETQFQNSELTARCEAPYVVLQATRDLLPGEEIWTSYGNTYDYHFMATDVVRDFFCGRAGVACDGGYAWEP